MTTKIPSNQRYYEAVGRRKTAVARVRIYAAEKSSYVVNDKNLEDYFPVVELQNTVKSPISLEKVADDFVVSAHVNGGGTTAQAEAIRHGIARALVEFNEDYRPDMRHADLLKRDPRKKERKKPGLRKARRAPQWSKR